MDDQINFISVPMATNYRLEISNAAQPFTTVNVRQNTVTNFKMSWISGVQYGRSYDVRVSVYVDGAWQPFGPVSTVNTPSSIPGSQLLVCNQVVPALNTVVYFAPVSRASNYRVELSTPTSTIINNCPNKNTYWALSYVNGTQLNTTYSIRIAAYVGGVWGDYGQPCNLTAGQLQGRTYTFEETISSDNFSLNIFPNPNNGEFTIDLTKEAQIIIIDAIGKEVLNHSFSAGKQTIRLENLENGVYFVNAQIGNERTMHKLIINK